ncbi:hypothetical protein N9W89_09405 [Hellea sp.]|nr:hypothetical protein [Hellea sp.]
MRISTLLAIATAISALVWKYLEMRHTKLAGQVFEKLDAAAIFQKAVESEYDSSLDIYSKEHYLEAASSKIEAFEKQGLAKLKVMKKSRQLSSILKALEGGGMNSADDVVQNLLTALKANAVGTINEIKKQLLIVHTGEVPSDVSTRRRRR